MRNASRNILVAAVVACFLFIGITGVVFADDVKVILKIPNVYCASKGAAAVDAARSIPGVSSALDDWENNTLTVVFNDKKTDIGKIKKELSAADFPSTGEEFPNK